MDNLRFSYICRDEIPDDARIQELLTVIQLKDLAFRYPSELSGGQRQRIALVLSILSDPGLLLLDEPFSALDSETREQLQQLARDWIKKNGATAIVVTHDIYEAAYMADTFLVLRKNGIEPFQCANRLPVARASSIRHTHEFAVMTNILKQAKSSIA